ncbi:MAG: type III pantothenate kinase [Mycoplasmataceae bacterium]|jgi:pantothenate kinase type III|nr:type III pantothenate kinase [Mycoplasmataceae bacterium]
MVLILDIGNTTTKFGVFYKNKLVKSIITPTKKNRIPKIVGIDSIYIGSVVTSINKKISSQLFKQYKLKPKLIRSKDFKNQFNLSKFNINEIGLDILALAMYIKSLNKKALGICFGTATFAIAINNKNIYGVSIAPSIEFGLKHLGNLTELTKTNNVCHKYLLSFGNSTKTALTSGGSHMARGYILSCLDYCKNKYDINHCYITGGKSDAIIGLPNNISHIDNAILKGYYLVARVQTG